MRGVVDGEVEAIEIVVDDLSEDRLVGGSLGESLLKLLLGVSFLFDREEAGIDGSVRPWDTGLIHRFKISISVERVIDVGFKGYGLRKDGHTGLGRCGQVVQI